MTRYTLSPNPKAKDEADPVYLIFDERKIIGAVYHRSPRWEMHCKHGWSVTATSLGRLRVMIRNRIAQEGQ